MKNLSKLNGAKALSKKEQMSINGGKEAGCVFSWGCYDTSSECRGAYSGNICERRTCSQFNQVIVKYCVSGNINDMM